MRRNLRRTGLGLLGAFVTLTIASLVVNALTVPPRTTSAPSGSDLQVAGHRIHYERWGDHGSPIVLVGGFAEWSYSWSLVGPLLGRDHVVYALDLPGYGYSQYTGRYTLADQTETVAGFIQALNLDRPALVGHSLGAAVVGSVGLRRPGLVSGVVFADGDALPFNGGQSAPPSWVVRSPYVRSLYRIGTRWSWLDEQIVKSQCGSVCAGYSPGSWTPGCGPCGRATPRTRCSTWLARPCCTSRPSRSSRSGCRGPSSGAPRTRPPAVPRGRETQPA